MFGWIILGILATIVSVIIFYFGNYIVSINNEEDDIQQFAFIKKLIIAGNILLWLFAIVFTISSCLTRINPGEVGVVVDLLGRNKGVEQHELTVGIHFVAPWKQVYLFPIFEQNHQWLGKEGFRFQTMEGLSVHADLGITFNLVPDRIHELFAKYRRGMEEITHMFIRNNIRDAINSAASKMRIEDLYGPQKEDFFKAVTNTLRNELEPLGFHISHLYIVGEFHVPDSVKDALNRKIEAIQRAQQRENELREAEAQAKKEIAKAEGEAQADLVRAKLLAESELIKVKLAAQGKLITAQAEADSNILVSKSLTAEIIRLKSIERWSGELPKVMSDSGNLMFLPKVLD